MTDDLTGSACPHSYCTGILCKYNDKDYQCMRCQETVTQDNYAKKIDESLEDVIKETMRRA